MKPAVLITGAGTGIGAATAKLFSDKNFHVVLLGRRGALLHEVGQALPSHFVLECDLKDKKLVFSKMRILEEHLVASGFTLTTLVNNAGIFQMGTLVEMEDSVWADIWETNMMGSVRLTRAVWPWLLKSGGGAIVNVSSTLGERTMAGAGAYSASKAAMINWTKTLALEGAPSGIRATCVCPGVVETPIHGFFNKTDQAAVSTRESYNKAHPLGRIGRPDEVADAIYFLSRSKWITGAILDVDGGINL